MTLALGDLKTALWHFSQYLAGLLARAAPAASPGDGSAPAPAWVQFHNDVAAGAWLLGATLHSVGVCDLAARFLQTAAGARHTLGADRMDRKETRVVLAWLRASLAAAAGGAEERVGGADGGGAAREAAVGQARPPSPSPPY